MTEKKSKIKCFRVFCTSEKERVAREIAQEVDERKTRNEMEKIYERYIIKPS
ncbi:hypothetical protein EHEL_080415 [Encephalitozoon hellem ATCC 50504]|uniref:Uncharacterized protein n=1 Tax=Encephalitozoon hellem TaxID=27973 RepID=A0ABY8CJY9_ENCHE|nr:uncharacterized protein EHEL_080415 [Encephalitozoon hellem ATCC 50504]AHL28958.1 hypothetical protein EHEL_080415 [Encephalitozoon hellem ATCC 50504]WEL39199.1 hypothetical protein PFJ87_08g00570 [Encephalitozoon hellem]